MGLRWKWYSSDTYVTVIKIRLLQVVNFYAWKVIPVLSKASHTTCVYKKEN